MIKFILLIIVTALFLITIDCCRAWNDTDLSDNITETISPKPFVYYGRYHPRRSRRQYLQENATTSDVDTIGTILSILPLDRLGSMIGQIVTISLKEILNPNIGKKIINVLENQAPALLTSLLTNLYMTLRVPIRQSTTNITVVMNKNLSIPLSNSSKTSFIRAMRRSNIK